MTEDKSPYRPPAEMLRTDSSDQTSSLLARNSRACAIVVVSYAGVRILDAFIELPNLLGLFYVLLLAGGLAATWANFQVGPALGWSRGGLPVLVLTVFAAMVAYTLAAFYAGEIVYAVIFDTLS